MLGFAGKSRPVLDAEDQMTPLRFVLPRRNFQRGEDLEVGAERGREEAVAAQCCEKPAAQFSGGYDLELTRRISESLRTGATPTATLTSEAYPSLKPSV